MFYYPQGYNCRFRPPDEWCSYDNLGRVTSIVSSDGTIDFDYAYATDENNISDIAFNHRTSDPSNDFVYDGLDRLYSVEYLDDNTDTEVFTMDLLGNRESVTIDGGTPETYAVDVDTNRYDADGTYTVQLAYDDAGNTTTDNDGYVYTYDYENRIVNIKDDSSNDIVTYTYDALGRRIKMVDEITAASETNHSDIGAERGEWYDWIKQEAINAGVDF